MKNILISMLILLTFSVFGCKNAIQKYDTLVEKDETCNQKWSDYEANLQRRSDMIPNLVEVVKGYASHEEKTLTEVAEARAKATQIRMDPKDFENPQKLANFQAAQNQLGTSLSRLMMLKEAYPDLKANELFLNLQSQIEGTENRILRSRQEYNKAVGEFNLEVRRISGKVINPATGYEFKPRAYFTADPSALTAPKINMITPVSSK
jgi:LemA protein